MLEFINRHHDIKDDLEHVVNSKVIFNFVNIKLALDSSLKQMNGKKDSAYQATVRFNSKTTFDELRKFICNFWVLNEI